MAPYQYKVGSSLDYQHPTYVQRRADVELHESLCRGEFCYVLNSRQMGKSSLRVQAMARLTQVGIKCAVIDLTEIGTYDVTPEKWYLGIIRRLVKSLDLGVKFEYRQWWRERDALSALDRFSQFIEEVLLVNISDNIVIFIDEIDSVLSLNFGDDFFACIRSCYDSRSDNAAYHRLTFCLLGVATPSDLMKDKLRTPFNIGQSIELTGFTFDEAKSGLLAGLSEYVPDPEMVLGEILQWTGGQPFLSQKLCQIVCHMASGENPVVVEDLVRQQIIENWEAQDEPEHLKTIKNRILSREKRVGRLLGLYQEILECGFIPADDGSDQTELRLAGLAVKQGGRLKAYNRIYECVFDQAWVTQELQGLRPYAEAINAWLDSNCQDESRLLRGQALQDALAWKAGKSLSEEDERFLDASQALEKREFQRALETEKEESRILANANDTLRKAQADANANLTKAQHTARRIIGVALVGLGTIVAVAVWVIGEAKSELNGAKIAEIKSMNSAATALLDVGNELESLMASLIATSNLHEGTIPPQIWDETVANLQERLSQVRERNQWQAHEGAIWEVRFSPNGELLATASEDNMVKIWSRQGELRATLPHADRVYGLDFSPDGSLIATASQEKAVKLWNLEGKLLQTFPQQAESLFSVSFHPQGDMIAAASKDGNMTLWRRDGQLIKTIKAHNDAAYSVTFSPDGSLIASASEDKTVKLWNLKGELVQTLSGYTHGVTNASFSSDGKFIATTTTNGMTQLWSKVSQKMSGARGEERQGLFAKYPRREVPRSGGQEAPQSRAAEMAPSSKLPSHQDVVWKASFSPQGRESLSPTIATASQDGTVKLWSEDGISFDTFKGYNTAVYSVSFSPDGQSIATASADGMVRIWRGSPLALTLSGHENWINSVSFSRDGQSIASASRDNTAKLWRLDGTLWQTFTGHQDWVTGVSFSPDGQLIATASKDKTAKLWSVDGTLVRTLSGHSDEVNSVSFSPDGQLIATTSNDQMVKLWHRDGTEVTTLRGHRDWVWWAAFSPDGQTLATASADDTVKLWRLDGTELQTLSGHSDDVNSVVFSPDGELIATAGDDRKILLWRVDGTLLKTLHGHKNKVVGVSFSPDGRYLASASWDKSVKIWSRGGELLATLKIDRMVNGVSFSADGKQLATAAAEKSVKLWRLDDLPAQSNGDVQFLLKRGCDWLGDYLAGHPAARSKLPVCQ